MKRLAGAASVLALAVVPVGATWAWLAAQALAGCCAIALAFVASRRSEEAGTRDLAPLAGVIGLLDVGLAAVGL